jgi:tetratricopeptide (TPR) repeat protein
MKRTVVACILALVFLLLGMSLAGAQATNDIVKFYYKKAKLRPGMPALYIVYVDVNGDSAPLFSVARLNDVWTAARRAEVIAGRLQQSWDVLPDREKLGGIIKVIPKEKVFVLAPSPTQEQKRDWKIGDDNPLPEHILQVDETDVGTISKSETPRTLLNDIRSSLVTALKQQLDLAGRPMNSWTLVDMKRKALEEFSQADPIDPELTADARRRYLNAIILNPEYIEAYEALISLTADSAPVFAKEVQTVLDTKVIPAVKVRQHGDDAYDLGPAGYDQALADCQQASKLFPECVNYYWLQSFMYLTKAGLTIDGVDLEAKIKEATDNKVSIAMLIDKAKVIKIENRTMLMSARQVLVDAKAKLTTNKMKIVTGAWALAGDWSNIFDARVVLLDSVLNPARNTTLPTIAN